LAASILVLSILFFIIVLVQVYLLKFRTAKPVREFSGKAFEIPDSALPPISIIVCAKNEADNLRQNIPFILKQDYPAGQWELIVVNDASTDETGTVLREFQAYSPQLNIINIPPGTPREFPGKKQALHTGLRSAKYPTVLLTDADCRPDSHYWIKKMAGTSVAQDKKIILGYGAYSRRKGLLNKMIQWETLQTCMQYMGMAAAGKPYMGVGRNLLYRKELYFEAIQNPDFLSNYRRVPSGDDDLLLAHVCNKSNTGICLQADSFTISQPETTVKSWLHQKSRHFSTGKFYPKSIKTILGLTALSQELFWLLCLIFIIIFIFQRERFENSLPAAIFAMCLLRLGLYWINAKKWHKLLGNRQLWPSYLLGEISQSLLLFILSPYIFRKNRKQWKS